MDASLSGFAATQTSLMGEEIILVDEADNVKGKASKLFCHKMSNISQNIALHRAFSVLLFNSKGELLLQQRSDEKITFPAHWTNTCCSHPLFCDDEMEMKDSIGAKRAALRKLNHELGIAPGALTTDDLIFLTRIIYKAPSDGEWGEHELDHIFLCKKDVEVNINPSEVKAIKYVGADELRQMFIDREKNALHISPWFHMICDKFFFKWWASMEDIIAARGLSQEEKDAITPLRLD